MLSALPLVFYFYLECSNPNCGTRVEVGVSLGSTVDAYFCDDSNHQVDDPVLIQGDTLQICVTKLEESSYSHVEDVYKMALTQPSTGVAPQFAVFNGVVEEDLASRSCSKGICNIKTQVSSRFFRRGAGPIRVVGVAILNFGPADRRALAGFGGYNAQYNQKVGHSNRVRDLQGDSKEEGKSGFELEAEVERRGKTPAAPPSAPIQTSPDTKASSNSYEIYLAILGAVIAGIFASLIIFCCLYGCFRSKRYEDPRKEFASDKARCSRYSSSTASVASSDCLSDSSFSSLDKSQNSLVRSIHRVAFRYC